MITTLRHLVVDSWVGRGIALLIFVAFIGWGANDVFLKPSYDDPNVLAAAGQIKITLQDFDTQSRLMGNRIAVAMGHKPGDSLSKQEEAELRQIVLQNLINALPLQAQASSNSMLVPDKLIRKSIFAMPVFQDETHHFSMPRFQSWLHNAQISESAFIQIVRSEIINLALGAGMAVGISAPHPTVAAFAEYLTQQHRYDVATFDRKDFLSAVQEPNEAALQRYYANHPWDYLSPEYRHARIVLLTAATLQQGLAVSDDRIKTLYESRDALYNQPEARDIQYIFLKDAAQAQAFKNNWTSGKSWDDLIKHSDGAISDTLTHMPESAIPSPELAHAAFKAPEGVISGPVSSAMGWIVFRVNKIAPAHHVSLAEVKDALSAEIRAQDAANSITSKVAQLQDAVAGDSSLDHIPSDLGGQPAEGAMSREGKTRDGNTAPIPGTDSQRQAILAAIFSQKSGAPPRFVALPDGGAFVVKVDQIEPGHKLDFRQARAAVLEAVKAEQLDHLMNEAATKLFTLAKAEGGVARVKGALLGRFTLASGQTVNVATSGQSPTPLSNAVLGTKRGDTGMIDAGGTYQVFTVTALERDPSAAHEARKALQQSADAELRKDVVGVFREEAARREKLHINQPLLQRVLHDGGA